MARRTHRPASDDLVIGPRAAPADDLAQAAVRHFGLGRLLAADDLGGTYALNLHLRTDAGDVVLRVHRPWVGADRLALLQRVRRAVRDAGLPAVAPLAAPSGATTFAWHDRLVEVEPFVPHDGTCTDWARYAAAFALLGPLHDALAQAHAAVAALPPAVSNYGTPALLLRWTRRTAARIRATPGPAAPAASPVCERAHALLLRLGDEWRRAGRRLPRRPIHGDYGGGNLLFAGERPVALLDFDFLGVRERVYELAYSAYWMFVQLDGAAPAVWSWPRLRELLDRYDAATARPLTRREREALPLEMARVPLYWVAEAAFLPDPASVVAELAERVAAAGWLLEQRQEIAASL